MAKQDSDKTREPLVTFPYKLWHLLEECDDGAFRWSDDGLSIEVDAAKIERSSYVQKYFRVTKMTSLVRQLNMYGFKKFFPLPNDCKINDGARQHFCKCKALGSVSCYKHEFFRRDSFALLSEVIRSKGTKSSKSSSKMEVDCDQEPGSSRGKEMNNNVEQLSYATPVYVEFMPGSDQTQMASIATIIEQPEGTVTSSLDVINQNTCFVIHESTFTRLEQHSMDESFDTSVNTTFDSEIWTVDHSFESDNSHVHFTWVDVEHPVEETYSSFSAQILPDDSF